MDQSGPGHFAKTSSGVVIFNDVSLSPENYRPKGMRCQFLNQSEPLLEWLCNSQEVLILIGYPNANVM